MMLERGPGLRVFTIPAVVSELHPNSRGRKQSLVEVAARVRSREIVCGACLSTQFDEALVLTRRERRTRWTTGWGW